MRATLRLRRMLSATARLPGLTAMPEPIGAGGGGGVIYPAQTRALGNGEIRVTEDGDIRITENTPPALAAPISSQNYYGNTAPVVANVIGIQIYTPA